MMKFSPSTLMIFNYKIYIFKVENKSWNTGHLTTFYIFYSEKKKGFAILVIV